jgi:hypothetical protein
LFEALIAGRSLFVTDVGLGAFGVERVRIRISLYLSLNTTAPPEVVCAHPSGTVTVNSPLASRNGTNAWLSGISPLGFDSSAPAVADPVPPGAGEGELDLLHALPSPTSARTARATAVRVGVEVVSTVSSASVVAAPAGVGRCLSTLGVRMETDCLPLVSAVQKLRCIGSGAARPLPHSSGGEGEEVGDCA